MSGLVVQSRTLALALSPKAIEDASMGGLYPLIVEKTTP